eukprot:3086244-Amphidinium_carterae.1
MEAKGQGLGTEGFSACAFRRSGPISTGSSPWRLPSDTQRSILTSAGTYDIDKLMIALELHYGGGVPPSRGKSGKDKGSKGKPKGHDTHEPTASAAPEPTGESTYWPGTELFEVAEALSVTAQKLKHITQSSYWNYTQYFHRKHSTCGLLAEKYQPATYMTLQTHDI